VARELDIVIVNYRSGDVLPRCVAAARHFAPAGTRFVFVDNSPDDGAVDGIAPSLPEALVVRNSENLGFAAAVNVGFRHSDASFVMLLNPDVVRITGEFDAIRRVFAGDPAVAAVTVRLATEAGDLWRCRRQVRMFDLVAAALNLHAHWPRFLPWPASTLSDADHELQREVEVVTGALLVLRRDAVAIVGPFDERFFMYWEETDWLLRARKLGMKAVLCPRVEATHLGRASSDVGDRRLSLLFVESCHSYTRKHFGAVRATGLRALWVAADGLWWVKAVARRAPRDERRLISQRIRLHLHPARRDSRRPPRLASHHVD
jgi:GT2 family glycosyltransferase